ncbi:DUF805 domain-containing protein [Polycladidibacter hongkongensis]|uniref:DUF805 domain-containing protein n=1 Tax=Polycladidibacter hongkongensis TaxID=1647556 RepID=UPI000833AA8D|nr:DUF805 domain-containing protein [Pseudovibrio hongkongensis]
MSDLDRIALYFLEPYRRCFDFSGRSNRLEYFIYMFVLALVSFFTDISIDINLPLSPQDSVVSSTFWIVLALSSAFGIWLLIVGAALSVRRLHDTGNTGWWVLLSVVPLANIGLILFLLFKAGDTQQNTYGAAVADFSRAAKAN